MIAQTTSKMAAKGELITKQSATYVISIVEEGNEALLDDIDDNCICITAKGRAIKPKTIGQKNYVQSIQNNLITLGIGPAGTGKTNVFKGRKR